MPVWHRGRTSFFWCIPAFNYSNRGLLNFLIACPLNKKNLLGVPSQSWKWNPGLPKTNRNANCATLYPTEPRCTLLNYTASFWSTPLDADATTSNIPRRSCISKKKGKSFASTLMATPTGPQGRGLLVCILYKYMHLQFLGQKCIFRHHKSCYSAYTDLFEHVNKICTVPSKLLTSTVTHNFDRGSQRM